MPSDYFFFQIQIDQRNLNTAEEFVFLQRVVAPNCDSQRLQLDDLNGHSVLESLHETGKAALFDNSRLPFCDF
jgi:hypothetical protein